VRAKFPAVLLLSLLVTAGCAHPGAAGVSRAIDDAEITTRVKTVLLNNPLKNVARIDVETSQGVVTLSGRVTSKDEEDRAVALARAVKGVVDVKSTLQIE
jgi:hyperosmotically inducible protein